MFERLALHAVQDALQRQAAVALIGPRQVGKTTLALEVARRGTSVYLDLESPADRAKLADAELYLSAHRDALVILDEIHRMPELFQALRGLIDRTGADSNRRSSRDHIDNPPSVGEGRVSGQPTRGG